MDIQKYENWKRDFRLEDDGLAAFTALEKLDAIRFELAVREEGYLDRIEGILA